MQPGLEESVPAYSRWLEPGDLKSPFQSTPFYDSMTIKKTQLVTISEKTVLRCFLLWYKYEKCLLLRQVTGFMKKSPL